MKLPKSKLGFLLVAVYVFLAGLFFIYAKFGCSTDPLYCGTLGFMPLFPTIMFSLFFNAFFVEAPPDFVLYLESIAALFINSILLYFIGSIIQRKFSSKVAQIVGIGAIIIAIAITGILGVRYFNKSDIWKPNIPVNVNNQINSRDYCQQDSDCVLASKYDSCCFTCDMEAVSIQTSKLEIERPCGIPFAFFTLERPVLSSKVFVVMAELNALRI